MKLSFMRNKGQILICCFVILAGFIGGAGLTLIPTFAAPAQNMQQRDVNSAIITPTPTPPSDNTIGLSANSGPPGTHIFIAASGYQPKEPVDEIWNYQGPGTGTLQHSFFYFNPTVAANASGIVYESFNIPLAAAGSYIIAAIGLKSNIVKTATFQLVPALDLGIYLGLPGTVLRFNGWGFGIHESISLYWNWSQALRGTLISTAKADGKGDFSNRSFTIPAGTTNGTYTLAAIGNSSQALAQAQFNVEPLALNAPAPSPLDWSMFGYDFQGTRLNTSETTIGPTNAATLSVNVNYPSEGSIGNFAYALDAETGALIWENYLPSGGEWVTPFVVNGQVFFSSVGKEGISGGLSAFDAYTGATIWSDNTNYGIWSPDTIDPGGSNLYVGTGNPCFTEPVPTNCASYLEDLNPTTGQTLWQIHFQDLSGDDDVPTAPVYNGGRLYLGAKNGIFYSIDATNGTILWQYNTGQVGDYGIFSSAAFYDNKVFFGAGDGAIHALNTDGSVAWSFQTGARIVSSPAIANGVLYIGSENGTLYALNAETGATLWSYKTGGAILSSPTISHGVLYITSFDGNVYAFSLGGV